MGVAQAIGRDWHQEHACCSIKIGGKLAARPDVDARGLSAHDAGLDVLVVGLGPAGASAAAAAARAGARVLAVDRKRAAGPAGAMRRIRAPR